MGTATNYNNKITIYQKNTKDIFCAVYDSSNNLMDLTDYTASLYGKKYDDYGDYSLDISIGGVVQPPATNGAILFSFTTASTSLPAGDYIYEVILEHPAGNRITVISDKLRLLDSIDY